MPKRSIFEGTWLYEKMMQEIEDAHAEGFAKGLREGQQQFIVGIVQHRFDFLSPLAQERIARVETPEELQELFLKVATAQTEEEMRRCLCGTQDTLL